jgi:hypothetical protein
VFRARPGIQPLASRAATERIIVSNDNDRIGLSGSTPVGREVRLASGLSGQTGWRRTVAKVFALVWLAGMVVAIVVAAVVVLT